MIIKVKVKPSSLKESLTKLSDSEYLIEIKEPAENNRANIRLTNILAKYFEKNPKDIKIKNPKSKNKLIDIKKFLSWFV